MYSSPSHFAITILDRLSETTKRTEKKAILQEVVGTEYEEFFKDIVRHAYDPSFRYGVTEYEREPNVGHRSGLNETHLFTALRMLNEREVTGDTARVLVEHTANTLKPDASEIFHRVLNHDLRCGVGAKSFNEVWPKLVYIHPYQRCSSFSQKSLSKGKLPCFSQVKMDGLYTDIEVTSTSVTYYTRYGSKLPINSPLRDATLQQTAKEFGSSFVIQGEALVLREDGNGYLNRADGNGYLNQSAEDIDVNRVVFVAWGTVGAVQFRAGSDPRSYAERFEFLKSVVAKVGSFWLKVVETQICNSIEDIVAHFKNARRYDQEGTVIKNFGGPWKDGTSTNEIKIKVVVEGELRVKGYKEGKGKYKGMVGSLTCESECGKLVTGVAGLSDYQREHYAKNFEKIRDKIIEVRYNDVEKDEITGVYSLFLPRFGNERPDKTTADTLERLQEQVDSFVDMMKVLQ